MTSGNDYLITVKGNQPKLFEQLQQHFEQTPPESLTQESECTRDRQIQRTVSVLPPPPSLDPQWLGIQRTIRVERVGTRASKPFSQTMFYISSLSFNAAGFAECIRSHWHIENRLHWVKDVVLREDTSPLCDGSALTNFAIIRTMVINLLRCHGFDSITQGLRQVAHDIPKIFSFCQ